MRRLKPFLALIALAVLLPAVMAQTSRDGESGLRVTVTDPTGATVPRARVQVRGVQGNPQTRETNARGEASFPRLAPGAYQVSITAPGFAPREMPDFPLRAGDNQLQVKLEIAEVQEELTVKQDPREAQTDPRGTAFTQVLTAEQIAQLPDDPEEFEAALQALAGPGATFRVNGFRGGKLPPKSQIREIRFRLNPYAAENHEAGFGLVDITTKPGVNSWHGSFNFGFRDEAMNARQSFATFRGPEQQKRFGLSLDGPLWKNRTSLFLNADGSLAFDAKTIV